MNWIIIGLFMYIASVVLYLAIKKAQMEKIPIVIYSLWLFGFPFVVYFLLALYFKNQFLMPIGQLIEIIFASFFFSWLGNFFSQKSIFYAPNLGYPLIISKSYVVLTTLAAVFLFHSELTLKTSSAIIFIVIFSVLIILSEENQRGAPKIKNLKWFFYSLGAFFCWGFFALISKHLLTQGLPPLILLSYVCFIVSILIILEAKLKQINLRVGRNHLTTLFLIGFGSMFFNLFMQIGYQLAPNPGYINAINAASISAVTIFSYFFFKDSISIKRFVGILGVTLGLIILLI